MPNVVFSWRCQHRATMNAFPWMLSLPRLLYRAFEGIASSELLIIHLVSVNLAPISQFPSCLYWTVSLRNIFIWEEHWKISWLYENALIFILATVSYSFVVSSINSVFLIFLTFPLLLLLLFVFSAAIIQRRGKGRMEKLCTDFILQLEVNFLSWKLCISGQLLSLSIHSVLSLWYHF